MVHSVCSFKMHLFCNNPAYFLPHNAIIMHLFCNLYNFILLYTCAGIYLISSARNKIVICPHNKWFLSFASTLLTPTQTRKPGDYIHHGNINIHISRISIFNPTKGFMWTPARAWDSLYLVSSGHSWGEVCWKYFWSQALCECLVRWWQQSAGLWLVR